MLTIQWKVALDVSKQTQTVAGFHDKECLRSLRRALDIKVHEFQPSLCMAH